MALETKILESLGIIEILHFIFFSKYVHTKNKFSIRIPTNRDIAGHWNTFLGFEPTQTLFGSICSEHFENACFATRDKMRLKANAISTIIANPIVQPNQPDELNSTIDVDNNNVPDLLHSNASSSSIETTFESNGQSTASGAISSSSLSPTIATNEFAPKSICMSCEKCMQKDELLDIKDAQIKKLRRSLNKANKRIWQLEKMKTKLNVTLLELKQQSLIDEKLHIELEVRFL